MKQASRIVGRQQAIWDKMFGRLAAFRKARGHGLVPVHYARNRKLGFWLSNQRQAAARGELRPERRRRLRALGVVFDVLAAQWEASYAALVEFKRRHGHTLVPREWKAPRGLGGWVALQRHLQGCGGMIYERNDQ